LFASKRRYEEKNDGRFAVKSSNSARKLQEVGDDCFLLVGRFKDHEAVTSMSSYHLLARLFIIACPEGRKPLKGKVGKNGCRIHHFDKAV
jgi:hypothetical protein